VRETFFNGNDGSTGFELWKTDGTATGTVLVKDINPIGYSYPGDLLNLNGALIFSATTPSFGKELWTSDGTPGGTFLYEDIVPGTDSSFPQEVTASNNMLYFTTVDHEIWVKKSPLVARLTPKNPPITLPVSGGSFEFDVLIQNESGASVVFDYWTYARRSSGGETDPLQGSFSITLKPGAKFNNSLAQTVPSLDPDVFDYVLKV